MLKRMVGSSGIEASAVGLGTWAIGGGPWWGETDDDESVKAIHAAIDAGINLIDTAPAYGFGRSEEVIGKALKGRRQEVILSTKCGLWWYDHQGSPFFEMDGYQVKRCLRSNTIRHELEESLKRLGTDYIDIYHTHWQAVEPDKTPIAETMECLFQLKDEGKIRSIGASNVEIEDLKEYTAAGGISVNQARYSMLDRGLEESVIPYCLEKKISIMAYSPLEQGLLTGKIGVDQIFDEDEYRNQIIWFKPPNRQRVINLLDGWREMAGAYDCTLAQMVIAWTLQQPGIDFALCGARRSQHALENAKAGNLNLKEEDILTIRKQLLALSDPE